MEHMKVKNNWRKKKKEKKKKKKKEEKKKKKKRVVRTALEHHGTGLGVHRVFLQPHGTGECRGDSATITQLPWTYACTSKLSNKSDQVSQILTHNIVKCLTSLVKSFPVYYRISQHQCKKLINQHQLNSFNERCRHYSLKGLTQSLLIIQNINENDGVWVYIIRWQQPIKHQAN